MTLCRINLCLLWPSSNGLEAIAAPVRLLALRPGAGSDRGSLWRETLTLDDPANERIAQNEACDFGKVNARFGFAFFELFQ
jgi:hypothetical protein